MNNPTVFITGINGFVGQNLRPYLTQDFDIQGISRKGKGDGLTYRMFLEENRPYDAIIHLAGKAHDAKNTVNGSEYYDVNYKLTRQLYDQFLQSKAEKFIYISSVKAAADSVAGVLTEDVLPHPITVYGKSKLMAENYILSNLHSTKKVYILRPCLIHGPGNNGNLNLLHGIVTKGYPWPLGAFDNQRSYCSIDNLCFVINELLVQNAIPSGVFNVADTESLSMNEVIHLISSTNSTKAKIWNVPKKLIKIIASIGTIVKLPINSERIQKLTESYVVSNVKIKGAIGKPLPLSAQEGLIKTFQSFNS